MLEDVGEIQDILGRSYGMPDGVDESDLDAELAFLGDQLESESFGVDEPATQVTAPSEPSTVFTSLPAPGYASTLPQTTAGTPASQQKATPNASNFNFV
jgi:charged multivesicular body protein 5